MSSRTPMSQSYVNSQAGGGAAGQQKPQQQQPQQQEPESSSAAAAAAAASQQQPQEQQQQGLLIGAGGEQMSQLMCATELTNLLLEFAFSVFVNKPQDIVDYAASYFNQLSSQRTAAAAAAAANSAATSSFRQDSFSSNNNNSGGGANTKRASSDSQRSTTSSQNSFAAAAVATTTTAAAEGNSHNAQQSDDEFDVDEQPPARLVNFATDSMQAKPKSSYNRRKSVFAEQYDPAADQEDDENNRVVHSKTDQQRQRLAKAIKAIFLFKSVEHQDMGQILDSMFEVRVSAGDVVIKQGDDGDNFYVIERGKFQIYSTQEEGGARQVRGELEDNGFFGELALMYNQPRAATVIALSDGSLWAMDRKTFRRIVLKSAFKKRKEYEALFEKVSVLQCLNGYERMNLCDALESKRFLNGQTIIVQGDQANGMYFIESGNVKIVKQLEDGRVVDVAVLGKGDYFGELALINHKPRAASVYAVGDDVKLAFLDVKAFERLLGSCIERMEKNCALYLNELAYNEGRQNV